MISSSPIPPNSTPDPTDKFCVICGGYDLESFTPQYLECGNCGHQSLRSGQIQQTIVNSILDEHGHRAMDNLTRHHVAVALKCSESRERLIDIGCASGKFLFHTRTQFTEVLGIETSVRSREFASKILHLKVTEMIPEEQTAPSLVTFWQSMEHIPITALRNILTRLSNLADASTRILISVPNGQSFQSKMYREHFTYFDVPNHVHQFSSRSLNLLMCDYGFSPCTTYVSVIYQLFGHLQSLINVVFPIHNYLYYRLKRGNDFKLSASRRRIFDALNLFAALLLCPVAALLSLWDIASIRKRGVITRCYKKQT